MHILILLGLTTIKQLETQGVGSLTGVIMFIFCNLSLLQWALFWVDVLRVVRFHQELSGISLPDDPHFKKHLDILRVTASY